jgi:hypothetical protein
VYRTVAGPNDGINIPYQIPANWAGHVKIWVAAMNTGAPYWGAFYSDRARRVRRIERGVAGQQGELVQDTVWTASPNLRTGTFYIGLSHGGGATLPVAVLVESF